MKQKHNHKKIFPACALLAAAGLAMAAAGCLLGGWVYGIQFDRQGIRVYAPLLEQESIAAREEKLEPFGEIAVRLECADVRIQASDSDEYALAYCLDQTGGLKKEVRDGRLVLENESVTPAGQENFKMLSIGRNTKGQSVTIYVPAHVQLSDVTVQTESGEVSCENIQADRLAIASSGGADIRLPENISHYEYQLKTEYGRIYLEGKDMGISCASVNGEAAGKITAVCEDGDIRIQ